MAVQKGFARGHKEEEGPSLKTREVEHLFTGPYI
jgi:hypothetical protein